MTYFGLFEVIFLVVVSKYIIIIIISTVASGKQKCIVVINRYQTFVFYEPIESQVIKWKLFQNF